MTFNFLFLFFFPLVQIFFPAILLTNRKWVRLIYKQVKERERERVTNVNGQLRKVAGWGGGGGKSTKFCPVFGVVITNANSP